MKCNETEKGMLAWGVCAWACKSKNAEASKTVKKCVANSSLRQQNTDGNWRRQGAISDVVQLVITVIYVLMYMKAITVKMQLLYSGCNLAEQLLSKLNFFYGKYRSLQIIFFKGKRIEHFRMIK